MGKDIDNCKEEEPAVPKPVRRGKDMATIMEVVEGKEKAEAVIAAGEDSGTFISKMLSLYSNHLNIVLAWHSNVYLCWVVKWSGFNGLPSHVTPFEYRTPILSEIQMNLLFTQN